MSTRMKLVLLGLVITVCVGVSGNARAQEENRCGDNCQWCVYLSKSEALDPDPQENESTTCSWGDCDACDPEALVKSNAPSADAILHAVLGADLRELESVVASYEGRLLLHKSRRVLAVRGTECSATAIPAVAFISPARSRALEALSVGDLADFLAEVAVDTE